MLYTQHEMHTRKQETRHTIQAFQAALNACQTRQSVVLQPCQCAHVLARAQAADLCTYFACGRSLYILSMLELPVQKSDSISCPHVGNWVAARWKVLHNLTVCLSQGSASLFILSNSPSLLILIMLGCLVHE